MAEPSRNAGFAYREQVGSSGDGRSALDYLADRYPHSVRARWAERLRAGEVELGGANCRPETLLSAGAWLTWHRPGWVEGEVPLTFEVVHEDAELLVVSKPPGLPTLPGGGFLSHTLQALVQARDPQWAALHRLGRGTSGLVLFARTRRTRSRLQALLRAGVSEGERSPERSIDKRYLALASGVALSAPRRLETPIGESAHPRLGRVHAADPQGRPSLTLLTRAWEAEPLPTGQRPGWRAELQLITGRPHQIRIHLAAAGCPLVGDPLYGVGGSPLAELPGLPGDGGYLLHAWRLAFAHPTTGEALAFEANPPALLAVSE